MNRNIRPDDPEFKYAAWIRERCPLGGVEWYKFMTVRMQPGERIGPHKHVYHTVLYYPELAEPVTVTPQPGTVLYLPPGTLHEVAAVKRERVSIAMLIEKEK